METLERYVYSNMPGFEEEAMRKAFSKAIPLRTLVVYCMDPRAADIPAAVAREFGEVWPGEVIVDDKGMKVGATNTLTTAVVVGGRAVDARRTIAMLNYMIGMQNVVVVHHTFCGMTVASPEGIVRHYREEQGSDIAPLFPRASLTIQDFHQTLTEDVMLLRTSASTPKHINLYGYVYDIDKNRLIKLVEDLAPSGEISDHASTRGIR